MANYNAIAKNTALGFKAGSQADLNKYLPGKENAGLLTEGVFYLTTDTHRLYIGRKSSEDGKTYPVPVNQGILSVNSIEDIKDIGNTGEFYYIEGSNILCIRSGNQWVQINPDTDTKITGFEASTEATTSNGAKITHTITTDEQGKDPYDSEFTIKGDDNVSVTVSGQEIIISSENTTNTEFTVTTPDETGYKIAITDSDNKTLPITLDPEIQYGGDSAQKSSSKFEKGILTLDVYTTSEVNNLLKTADALVFRGIIDDYSKLPDTEVQNGDTYKVGTEFTHEGTTYKVGDILIAHGTETNDYLPAGFDWIHIPAGDEVYTGGTLIDVNPDGTISHEAVNTSQTTGESIKSSKFNVIDSIVTDTYGHITEYTIKEVTPQLVWDTF